MLPTLHLDDEMYSEILEQARNQIALYCPQWTDYNEHDPGITFLELFSWMKEAQQFYMDHMDKPMQSKFLQLLGLQCRHNCPASGWLMLESGVSEKLLPGTPFYAEKLCLILQDTAWSSGTVIASMTAANGTVCHLREMQSKQLRFFPFGETPQADDVWELTFEKPLLEMQQLTLYASVFEEYPIRRNPPQEGYAHLAEWQAEAKVDGAWLPCTIASDETVALTVSGQICLTLPPESGIQAVRFRLSEQVAYDVPPLLTGIRLDVFPVEQLEQKAVCSRILTEATDTQQFHIPLSYPVVYWQTKYLIRDEIGYLPVTPDMVQQTAEQLQLMVNTEQRVSELLAVHTAQQNEAILYPGTGDGFPYQEFDLHCKELHYDSFCLLIYDSYDSHWHLWEKTDSMLEAGHLDRVYQLDEKNGKLLFGDGIHGRMPDGELWIVSLAFTRAENGNLKNGAISDAPVSAALWQSASYWNLTGGAPSETPQECRLRGQYENRLPARAVTKEDYAKLVYAAPGLMIRSCHVSAGDPEQNAVHIAVEPYTGTEKAEPNPVYLQVLEQFLEPRRLIGTRLEISFPQYADIHLYVVAYVRTRNSDGEAKIRAALAHLFQTEYHVFGKPVLYSAVYAAIDLMPEVQQIQTLVMQCRSDCVRINRNGDLFLPENGLPYLRQLELKLISTT